MNSELFTKFLSHSVGLMTFYKLTNTLYHSA